MLAVVPVRAVLSGASGRELIAVLGATGRTQLVTGVVVGHRHRGECMTDEPGRAHDEAREAGTHAWLTTGSLTAGALAAALSVFLWWRRRKRASR